MVFKPINPFPVIIDPLKGLLSRNLLRCLHGMERMALGPLAPQVKTPHLIRKRWDRCNLIRYYDPDSASPYRSDSRYPPVLIVPPLMVTPAIFDLRPGHSLVSYLIQAGIEVFILDFGVPTLEDKDITLEDYVDDFIPNAVCEITRSTGYDDIHMVGWSMGGIFILIYTALNRGRSKVRDMVIVGSPIAFSEVGLYWHLARVFNRLVIHATDLLGNLPPVITRTSFKMLSPVGWAFRYVELIDNLWDREWVMAFESIDQWVDGFIPYPGETFKRFFSEFIADDGLRRDRVKIGERPVKLKGVECPIMIFAGKHDKVAPLRSVTALSELVGSRDKHVIRVPLGHIGLVAGSAAQNQVWRPMLKWIKERS